MFNWTTTTILNSLKDANGLDLVKVWTKDLEDDDENKLAGFTGQYPVIKIKRDHTFETRYITSVYKEVANDPEFCEMEIDCEKIADLLTADDLPAHLRLTFYVALEGSEESIYANDGYQKGKQFSVGFDVTSKSDTEAIAKKIKNNAEKYGVVMYGKKIFDMSVTGSKLTIKGTHEYQRFYEANVALDDVIDEKILDYIEMPQEDKDHNTSDGKVFKLIKRGENGFGTYHYLIKNLRLPTAQNTRWLALGENAKPAVGGKYNQYIITYCAPSLANPGFTVIGQHNNSLTTHVFWVNKAIVDDFEGYLEEAGITKFTEGRNEHTHANSDSNISALQTAIDELKEDLDNASTGLKARVTALENA